ncbi:hypothetical protein BLNAU_16944 [Blattamonas nauphoetae]|uniref:Uncharacterized protein n=1 Tax=Blattamonas nauphoetae TaxID=2049346 RepID=A0ABQ9XBA2_9EUKA|nr:hypothetical protein BLNAU_16944 [Blattamonas nauphoetae]
MVCASAVCGWNGRHVHVCRNRVDCCAGRQAEADASNCWDCGKCVWSAGGGWGCGGCCGVCGVSAQEGRESAEEVAGVAASAESGREAEAPSEQHSPLVSECSGGHSVTLVGGIGE